MRDVPDNNSSLRDKLQWINEALFEIEKSERKLNEITDEKFRALSPEQQQEVIGYSKELQDKYRRLLDVKQKLSLKMELIKKDITDTHTPDNINDFPPMNPEVKDIKSNFISYRQADFQDFMAEHYGDGLIVSCEWHYPKDVQGLGDERWKGEIGAMYFTTDGNFAIDEVDIEDDDVNTIARELEIIIDSFEYSQQTGKYEWQIENHIGYPQPDKSTDDGTELKDKLLKLAKEKEVPFDIIEEYENKWAKVWKIKFYGSEYEEESGD